MYGRPSPSHLPFTHLAAGETAVALHPLQHFATITLMTQTLTQELAWARQHLPRLHRAMAHWPPMQGVRLACSMHLDLKMAPLVERLLARGAQVFLTTCNATTVQDAVVKYLVNQGPRPLPGATCPLPTIWPP